MRKISEKKLYILSTLFVAVFSFSFVNTDLFEVSKNLDIFNNLYRELNQSYVDETKPGQLMKTAIDGMLESLDPYTNYITENDIEEYMYMTTGEYGGYVISLEQEQQVPEDNGNLDGIEVTP